jgi:EamA domain-containing membrane protein RarD
VVVAVLVVLAVDVAVDHVIDMSLMGNRHMFAPDAVQMVVLVRIARMARIARKHRRRVELMLVYVIVVRMVQMSVVQVVHVIAVAHREVTAAGSVYVLVPIVNVLFQHIAPKRAL